MSKSSHIKRAYTHTYLEKDVVINKLWQQVALGTFDGGSLELTSQFSK
mgnify:CR=1 FL=1